MQQLRRVLAVLILSVLAPPLHAAEVIKVKGQGVLVELKGDPAVAGDVFYVISPDGKRVGIIKMAKVKGDKAIGKLLKGKAQPGATLEFKPQKVAKSSSAKSGMASPSLDDGSTTDKGAYWGAMLGFSMDTMEVNVLNSSNVSVGTAAMSGTGYSAKALFDYELMNSVWFRGAGGIEMFNVSGGNICGPANNTTCDASLTYLSLDLIGRYVFGSGSFRPWVGGGVGLLFPAQKDSSALDSSSISTTSVMLGMAGVDWFSSPTFMIPISVEYGMLPSSDEVSAHWIAVRAGFAVPF